MKTLAIDSSLPSGSVAAMADGRISELQLPEAGTHARLIAGALVETSAALGWTPGDAELIGVVRGPGSFTGLRVGLATAKAMAWAGGAKLVGVSGFEVIARRAAAALAQAGAPIHIAYDAGRGELFAAEVTPAPHAASGWSVGSQRLSGLDDWLHSLPQRACVSGPGLVLIGDRLGRRNDLVVAPRQAWVPTAGDTAALALLRAAAGEFDEPAALVPDYLRPSYADETAARPAR
jgi:tRNA threonylcarbamoyladenosine biosynthesis protein TsaB